MPYQKHAAAGVLRKQDAKRLEMALGLLGDEVGVADPPGVLVLEVLEPDDGRLRRDVDVFADLHL